jgi:hypothetical protein
VSPGEALPAVEWLFLDLGSVYVAIFPLRPTHLGGEEATPVSLHRDDDGRMRLAIANYDGPPKYFWKYARLPWERPAAAPGPFFNGHLRAGVLVETADAASVGDFAAFRQAVAASHVTDTLEGDIRRVRWQRDGHGLELAVDMTTFAVVERLVDGQPLAGDPFLIAPEVAQIDQTTATINGMSVAASAPGPWVAQTGDGTIVVNPTFAEVTVTIGQTAVVVPAFARATVDARGAATVDQVETAVQ